MALKASLLALAVASLQPIKVDLPEIKDDIFVKKMSLGEREAYFKRVSKLDTNVNATAFTEVVCDKDGNKVLGDEDIADINKLPPDIVDKVLDTFVKANGLEVTPKKAVETAEKNSEVA